MRVLGIDPGIATLGYGVVEYKNNKFFPIAYGAITTDAGVDKAFRLYTLYKGLEDIIKFYRPEIVAIEELFYNKNSKTVITIGEVRGISILAAVNLGVKVYEYTPLQVKQAVVGYGRAEKLQVQQMVKVLLNLDEIPKPDDVADALAVAICHCHSNNMLERLGYVR